MSIERAASRACVPHHESSHIVALNSPLAELAHGSEQMFEQRRRVEMQVGADARQDAIVAELFTGQVDRFTDPVAEDDEDVTGGKRQRRLRELGMREQPQ